MAAPVIGSTGLAAVFARSQTTGREVEQATVPGTPQIKQRGAEPAHYEIMPAEGANLTPDQFRTGCQGIGCKR